MVTQILTIRFDFLFDFHIYTISLSLPLEKLWVKCGRLQEVVKFDMSDVKVDERNLFVCRNGLPLAISGAHRR